MSYLADSSISRLMYRIGSVLLFLLMLVLSSCGDMTTEMWISSDGSGEETMIFDIGTAMEISAMIEQEPDEMSVMVDTMVVLFDVAPDSVKNELDNPELLKKITMGIDLDREEDRAILSVNMKYDSEAERNQLILTQKQMSSNPEEEEMSVFSDRSVDLEKGILKLSAAGDDLLEDEELVQFAKQVDSIRALPDDDFFKGMLLEMLDSETKLIIHLPGAVNDCSIEGAVIDAETVTITSTIAELITAADSDRDILIQWQVD